MKHLLFLALAAAVVLTAAPAQEAKGPAKLALELAREAEAGKDVTKRAAALAGQLKSVQAAMRLYSPRSRGGVGLGPKGVGIERRLLDLGEDGIAAEALKKESADLIRLAHVNLVVAEATRAFAPAKPFLGRGRKEWERDLGAVQEASRDFLKAVKAGDPKAVQSAAARVNKACDSCHDGAR
jgi:hypothetical protein